MTDPIHYLSMILWLTGVYVLISSFADDDDDSNNDDGERYIYNLKYFKAGRQYLYPNYFYLKKQLKPNLIILRQLNFFSLTYWKTVITVLYIIIATYHLLNSSFATNYKKKTPISKGLFLVLLNEVFPCFHCFSKTSPTHTYKLLHIFFFGGIG